MDPKSFFKYPFLLLLVLIQSCSNDDIHTLAKPDKLLPRDKMANILIDMHLADAGLQLKHLSPDSLNRMYAGYDNFIYKKHQITPEVFKASFDYYLSVPTEMDSIYLLTIDILNAKESQSRGIIISPGDTLKKN